jgi:hypothetical protein
VTLGQALVHELRAGKRGAAWAVEHVQERADYRYDFFERLNWRQTLNMTPAGATHYVQDLSGQLIYEATDTGTPLREYVWVDDMPVAVFADLDTASPQLYYVHPDHLNRPLRMTDGSKAVVWDAVYRLSARRMRSAAAPAPTCASRGSISCWSTASPTTGTGITTDDGAVHPVGPHRRPGYQQ